jgi:PAS domain S-box-containing protein
MHAQRAPDETRQRVRREAWTWALTLSLLAVALLWWGLASRANLQQRERDRLAGQARAVELNLARNVEGVHAALRFLRDEAASWPVGQQAATLGGPMQALRDAMPGVQALLWLDANGRVLASSQAALVGTDLERVPFYSALRDQPDPALLVISGPQPEGAQGPVLNLALVVPPASARFGGALVARLDASFFSTVLDSVRYADDMQADVVHAGGTVLVASPPSAGVRSRAQPDTPFMQHRESGLQESVRLGQMPGQAGVRLVAQRNFRPTTAPMDGLVLSVSRALDDVREPWQRQVAIAAMAFLALLGGSWQAMRLLQRRRHEMVALASERAAQQAAHADQLALALRGADLALWDAELPGGRMSVNERWFTMIGLQPGEVTPDNEAWQSRLHPEDKVAVLAALQSHLQGQSASFEATYRLRHRDGHWVWILDRARVVDRDPAGVPRRMVGTHMDVSAGMQSREALRDREAQLSSMADALPGPVARLDREGRYLFVNATYERWFGLRPHEMLGRRRDEVLAAHAIERLAPQIERALAGESITLDSVAPTLQGARQVMVALVPDRDAHGAVQGCFVVVTDITVRKQAEDALRLSEQKSRALLEALRSGVMVYAADTSLRDANPAACHILGERLEDMRGRRANDAAWDFLDEDGSPLDPERHPVSRVVASGQPLRDRVMGVRRAGEAEPGWMLCSAFPLYGESGILLEVVVAMADFTERKLAVEALRRSESRWRLAGRLARLGGWHYEAPQGPLAFSTELGELLGAGGLHALTPDEARQLLPGASNERWQHQIEACLVGGAAFDVELEASSVDGRLVHLRVLGEGIRDAGNRLIAVEGAVQDITERKLGEASLRAAQSELAATLAAVPDLLFDVDLRGRIFAQHSPNTQLLLMSPREFMGRLLDEVLPAEAAAVAHSALQQAHAVGHSSGLQYELTLAGGRRWFELSVSRRAVPPGELPRFIVLARDVTERKQSEAERRALERQLREAQKMESIGTLAGGIAHDFNNILAAILGNVALASEDLPSAHAARSSLDQIRRAGLRARSLVQQILTFSRRQPNELVGQSLRPVVEETVALLRATLPAWVRLQTVLPDAPVQVQADATQLQQVVMNLCTNAWHALPEGRGHIEVGLEALSADAAAALQLGDLPAGPCAHVWVRDTGCGMEASLVERIFDPFFTTKPPGHGTGLGLSVVHGIVRGHLGVVQVQSKLGEGSTFHVYLPAVAPAPFDEGQGGGPVDDAAGGVGQHVIYVDDDEVMVLMVQRLLQRAGYRVTTCTAPAQLLALLREQPALGDLVVSDYNMPEMSGLELAIELARLRPALPVVISSGYIADELRQQARAVGVRALLKKENTLEELPGLVQQVLAGRDED